MKVVNDLTYNKNYLKLSLSLSFRNLGCYSIPKRGSHRW